MVAKAASPAAVLGHHPYVARRLSTGVAGQGLGDGICTTFDATVAKSVETLANDRLDGRVISWRAANALVGIHVVAGPLRQRHTRQ